MTTRTRFKSIALLVLWLCLGWLQIATRASGAPQKANSARPTSSERTVLRAFLPSAENVQGEFRLLRRGHDWVAQTVLDTTSFRRAIQKLRRKELQRWRDAVPTASNEYLDLLASVRDEILALGEADNGRHQLLIEIGTDRGQGYMAFFALDEIVASELGLTISLGQSLQGQALDFNYVLASIKTQAKEAFGEVPPELLSTGETP